LTGRARRDDVALDVVVRAVGDVEELRDHFELLIGAHHEVLRESQVDVGKIRAGDVVDGGPGRAQMAPRTTVGDIWSRTSNVGRSFTVL